MSSCPAGHRVASQAELSEHPAGGQDRVGVHRWIGVGKVADVSPHREDASKRIDLKPNDRQVLDRMGVTQPEPIAPQCLDVGASVLRVHSVEEVVDPDLDRSPRSSGPSQALVELLHGGSGLAQPRGDEELILRIEVAVERTGAKTGFAQHRCHRHILDALRGDHSHCRLEERLTLLLGRGRLRPAATGHRSPAHRSTGPERSPSNAVPVSTPISWLRTGRALRPPPVSDASHWYPSTHRFAWPA